MRIASLLVGVALAGAAGAQIVVRDANEPEVRPVKVEAVVCSASINDGRIGYSTLLWVPNDRATLERMAQEFRDHVTSTVARARVIGCHSYPSYNWFPKPPGTTVDNILYTGWSGGYPTSYPGDSKPRAAADKASPKPGASAPQGPVDRGPTPNELKYQRELTAYKARLEEIERIKAETAARHAANRNAAQQQVDAHDQDMARHRREVAAADAARRQYEQDLAAHQALLDQRQSKADRDRKVDWREAIVVCQKKPSDGQSRFGNWRCEGPLQMTYAKLDAQAPTGFSDLGSPAPTALSQACGTRKEAVRDLGMVGDARLYGCSFGLHPNAKNALHVDQAARHGISYVPGRAIYRCPAWHSACRTH
jgi:hypothetical protein